MTKTKIETLLRIIDAGEFSKLTGILHPDICYRRPGYAPLQGIDRVLSFYLHERVIASGVHHIEAIIVDRDDAACRGRFVGRSKDGRDLAEEFADVYRFAGDQIIHRQTYFFRPAI